MIPELMLLLLFLTAYTVGNWWASDLYYAVVRLTQRSA